MSDTATDAAQAAAEADDNDAIGDADATHESSPPPPPPNTPRGQGVLARMYVVCREVMMLLLLLASYAAFQTSAPKVSKSPVAYPFFPAGSVVRDWYRGQLTEAIELASESDVAFVMFYAPWDADSQAVRTEFDAAAQLLLGRVHFAAINCWQPGGECRHQYSKVYAWPVLMAYPVHGRGVQYRGLGTAPHMVRFLRRLSAPLLPVRQPADLRRLRVTHDAVALAHVHAAVGSAAYGAFYSAALAFLEHDPYCEVAFAVRAVPAGSQPTLALHLWNRTLHYPAEERWAPEDMVKWVSDSVRFVMLWMSPMGGKSHSLAMFLQPGPALLLFTPRNPLDDVVPHYLLVRALTIDYHNCNGNADAAATGADTLHYLRELQREHDAVAERCAPRPATALTYDLRRAWPNDTCSAAGHPGSCASPPLDVDVCGQLLSLPGPRQRNTGKYPTSMWTGELDPRAPAQLEELGRAEKCRQARLARALHPAFFPDGGSHLPLTGLACKTNASLFVIALDSLQHHHFAEALGVDVLNAPQKTAVVIVTAALETQHVMEGAFGADSLSKFITNYTRGNLERTLGSTRVSAVHTHRYGHSACQPGDLCITELDTDTFLPTVSQPDTCVLVFYYSTKCAFCSGVSYVLLSVARVLAPVTRLRYARIDGDAHALPWEYTMHQYPTLLFFPARRKSDSRAFPQNVPVTVPNVISFMLANVEPEMKLQMMWTLCKRSEFEPDMTSCSRTLRTETRAVVGRMLRAYRSSTDVGRRNALLECLQRLRALQLLLAAPAGRAAAIDKAMRRVGRP